MLTYAHVCSPGIAAGMFADPSKMYNSAGVPAPSHWYTTQPPRWAACPHTSLRLSLYFTQTVLRLHPFYPYYFTRTLLILDSYSNRYANPEMGQGMPVSFM